MTREKAAAEGEWVAVCPVGDIVPNTGVCCLIAGQQVALFRLDTDALYAIGNYDPFSKANVLSRGIVGDRAGHPKVASPIYKQSFSLETGVCMDDDAVSLPTYAVRVRDGIVEVSTSVTEALPSGNKDLLAESHTA